MGRSVGELRATARRLTEREQARRGVTQPLRTDDRAGAGGASVTRMVIQAVGMEHLTCRKLTWNADTNEDEVGEDDIYVARPYQLRNRTWTREGRTYTPAGPNHRTVNGQDEEVLTHWYVAGDEIHTVRVRGGSGLRDPMGEPIGWVDVNTDGRMWAEVDES